MTAESFKSFAVVNPHAANRRTGRLWPQLAEEIRARVGPFDHALTSGPNEATALTREALARGAEMVISVGGDGTHSEVVNGFFDSNSPVRPGAVLAVLSSGTGGDLRRTLGHAPGPFAALDSLAGRGTHPLDVGRYRCRDFDGNPHQAYFVNILSFGMGGLVSQTVNRTTKALGGRASFFMGTLRAVAAFRPPEILLSLDGESPQPLRIHNVAVANGRFFGGGMMVAPDAAQDDGLFDVVTFADMSTAGFLALGLSIYNGRHLERDKVTCRRARRITARCPDPVLLDVDGEVPGTLPLDVEIVPRALRIKVAG